MSNFPPPLSGRFGTVAGRLSLALAGTGLAAVFSIVAAVPAYAGSGVLSGPTSTTLTSSKGDEGLLNFTAYGSGTDWLTSGSESAAVTVSVDGQYQTDVVLHEGANPFTYQIFLGSMTQGTHTVSLAYNPTVSTTGAAGATITSLSASSITSSDPNYNVVKYAPILYGRDIYAPYENNHTDTPAILYHTSSTDSRGNTTIEYTYVFSNEDGGTGAGNDISALMARWGRSTDIEWAFRVTIDRRGHVHSEEYQGDNHSTNTFTGATEGSHPLLYTKTSNNTFGMASTTSNSGYRFSLDPTSSIDAGRTREQSMDNNPYSYQLMSKEAIREGDIWDTTGDPSTMAVSDLRNYAYLELNKSTSYVTQPASGNWVGVALAVQLKGDPNWYISDHNSASVSIQRDGPAATTVELPQATRTATTNQVFDGSMVQAIKAFPVEYGTVPHDYSINFQSMYRGLFLDSNYLPQSYFVSLPSVNVTLTYADEANGQIIWTNPQ